MTAFK
jgi:hypothetical protein